MPHGMSLHIGLNSVDPNHYEGWDGTLVACENDANDMQKIASSLGYETRKLLTTEATRSAVIDAIAKAANHLKGDDIFFLTYSGHGGQVPDTNGDDIDGKDETWVLFDGEVVDDELHELYTRFKAGTRLVVLSDSCHSGTVTRAYRRIAPVEAEVGVRPHADTRFRVMPSEVQAKVNQRYKKDLDRIQEATKAAVTREPDASVLLISGCQDRQTSADGDVNGLFTETLLKVWNNGTFQQDYRHFQKAIKRRMPPSQKPNYYIVGAANTAFERQRPFSITAAATIKRTTAA
jgi:metacaspase-1